MIKAIPQNNIQMIWGDVWLRTANDWQSLPQQKRLDLIGECREIHDIQDNIYKGRANLDDYRYLLDTPAERFMDHVAIPLITVGSLFSPASAPVAFSGSARTAAIVVPKLKQIATALGAAEVLEETMTFFSKKAGETEPGKKTDPGVEARGMKDPKNVNTKLRLNTELAFKEAGILDKEGKLTQQALKNAKQVRLSSGKIDNPQVRNTLIKDGSKIEDWAKFTTDSVRMSSGQSKQIHFYRNLRTGRVDYETIDFKIKDSVTLAKGLE